eukprot:12319375-Alexandrium_andersonii.AAC.1
MDRAIEAAAQAGLANRRNTELAAEQVQLLAQRLRASAARHHHGDHRALAALRAPLWDAYVRAWDDWYFYRLLGQVMSQLYYLCLGWGDRTVTPRGA